MRLQPINPVVADPAMSFGPTIQLQDTLPFGSCAASKSCILSGTPGALGPNALNPVANEPRSAEPRFAGRWPGGLAIFALLIVSGAALAGEKGSAQDSTGGGTVSPSMAQSSPLVPLSQRIAPVGDAAAEEVPDFQRHVSPLLGRLGCNGRACHGSFQGQGGFQLSLFGYDFEHDYQALLEPDTDRVATEAPLESMILTKPVSEEDHGGGKRFEQGGWEYWVLRRWVEAGAPTPADGLLELERLEVIPSELSFDRAGQSQQLSAIAHWADGTREDVTCLCRFHSNDDTTAAVDASGVVTSGQAGDTHVVVSYDKAVVPVLAYRPFSQPADSGLPQLAATAHVDQLVLQKLNKLGIVPSSICTDEEFLRRASLDITGTLPAAAEVLEFIKDPAKDKRAAKVDELLARPGYVAQWTTFLCDLTGNNEDQLRNFLPQSIRPENQWYQWLYARIEQNMPYDKIVEGIVTANSRLPDESYREYCESMTEICRDDSGKKFAERPGLVHFWARNNFKTAEDRAVGFAYSFLGVRIQCAQCHKHPFDQWSKDDFDNFERLFEGVQANANSLAADARPEFRQLLNELQVDQELKGNLLRRELGQLLKRGNTIPFPELTVRTAGGNRNQRPNLKAKANAKLVAATPRQAKLLGGEWVPLDQPDVRQQLMDWLRAPDNPYFAQAIVNRVWAQYFGVGIVSPADDLNLANAPSNAPLLDYLSSGFVEHGYDLKWLHREIANSDAYQRSWVANETNALDRRNFSRSQLRRLPAETSCDAVRMAVSNDAVFEKGRMLDLPRAVTKPGASARNAGRDDLSYALGVFGRSSRETNCDCDRSSEPSLLQTVFLVNDAAVQKWLSDPQTSWSSQVANKFGWQRPAGQRSDGPRPDELSRRLAAARAAGRSRQIVALEAQLARQQQNAAGSATDIKNQPATDAITAAQARWIAEQAYLRTLSRQPQQQELSTAIGYLRAADDPVVGVQELMWGLINTKEFILNH